MQKRSYKHNEIIRLQDDLDNTVFGRVHSEGRREIQELIVDDSGFSFPTGVPYLCPAAADNVLCCHPSPSRRAAPDKLAALTVAGYRYNV